MNPFYRCMRAIVVPIAHLVFPCKFLHREKMPKNGRLIVCSNHISAIDPVYLGVALNRQLHFISKAELFKNKLLGWFLKKLGAFPVVRGTGDSEAKNTALEILEEEKVLGIFPEGTRSHDGNLLRPKSGMMIFANKTHSPIFPAAIVTKNGKVRPFKKTVVSFGTPITPEELGLTGSDSPAEMRNAARKVMEIIAELREEALRQLSSTEKRQTV